MSDREPNEEDMDQFLAELFEGDVPRAEDDRRLDFSCEWIQRVVAKHGTVAGGANATRYGVSSALSKRQALMLAFIRDYIAANSYPPSLREIAEGCDTSSISVVAYNLRILEKREYLTRTPAIPRSIVLTERGWSEAAALSTPRRAA